MKVLFLTNVPAPYRVDFFNELGKLCDLTVIFEKKTSTERDNSWSKYKFNTFKGIFLKGISLDTDSAFCPQIIKYLKKETYDHIIVSNFLMPTGMIAIEYMRLRKIKYYLEIDGGFAKTGDGIVEKIKRHFIKGADKYFSTAGETDNYYLHYGALPEKIVRYPFTSLKNEDLLPVLPQSEEKKQLREKLGIEEKNIIISVGRFSYKGGYGKGFDILMNIADKLPDGTGIYIIGDSATSEFLRIREERQLSNVHFVEYVEKDRLSLYYRAADLFVLLSRGDVWGLVVNEAMAHGLPVISSDKTIAGLELVTDGENGYVVSLDDEENIVNKITEIIDEPKKQRDMARKSRLKIADHTIEKMSETHYNILSGGYYEWIKLYFKKKLGLTGDYVVLAVGQFIKRKGFDLLLKAAADHRFKNIQFIFVGGEATEEYLQIIADKKICNCEFVKFKNKNELQEYYLAADLFVHPTREDIWGLVINEAMAYGLPVITTTKCIAGLEMVHNNENGFLVPCNDLETLILTLENSLNDEMLKKYSRRSREIIVGYTVEKMAKRHFDILDEEAIKNGLYKKG